MQEVWNEERNYVDHPEPMLAFDLLAQMNQFIIVKYNCSIYCEVQRPPSEVFDKQFSGNQEAFLGCPKYPRIFSPLQKCYSRKELSNDVLSCMSTC